MRNERLVTDLEAVPSEDLIGRRCRLALAPEVVGHITCVQTFRAGRTYLVDVVQDGALVSLRCDDYQLELIDG